MIQLEQLLILLLWPGLGLASLVFAVRWFIKHKPVRAGFATILGLGLLVSFAFAIWFSSQIFGPVDGKPDSSTSQTGFESLTGFAPPDSISNLRYWYEGFTDHIILMRFQCSTPETIEKIIQSLDLKPVKEARSEVSVPDIEWWKKSEGDTVYKVYSVEYDNLWRYLWIDEATGTVFYQEYST